MPISVNENALRLVEEAVRLSEKLRLIVEKTELGATVIDAGVKAHGGYAAGRLVTEICLGGYGEASISFRNYGDVSLPTIDVQTDFPAVATLGAQFAGWQIKTEKYFAMGSGPARALALKPKELYEKINYRDSAEHAVIVLESDATPTPEAVNYIANQCRVKPSNLYLVVASTSSITGSVQISGRIVETGIHKLTEVGFDPKKILYGCGYAPIAPIHPKSARAMGRTNDTLYYGGVTYYTVDYEDDEQLKQIVDKTPSSTAKDYGKPFYDIFKAAGFDFYKIDPNLFAPAVVVVNNIRTGVTHKAGTINPEVLRRALGIT